MSRAIWYVLHSTWPSSRTKSFLKMALWWVALNEKGRDMPMVSGMATAPSATLSIDKHFYIRKHKISLMSNIEESPREHLRTSMGTILISAHLPFLKQPQVPGYGAPRQIICEIAHCLPPHPPHISKALRDSEDSNVTGRGRPDLFIMKHYN